MYNSDTELLFPLRVVSTLGALRGDEWQALLDRVSAADASLIEQTAFVLMMVRMDGCVGCNADSFRAMKGCTQCARQNIRRHRGSDAEIVELFEQICNEVQLYLNKKKNVSSQ
jgi:hypothetical protein